MGAAGIGGIIQMAAQSAGNQVATAGSLASVLQQERAARFQGRAARKFAFEQAKLARAAGARRRARNRSRIAAAGVDLSEGTPVEIIANQAAMDELQARTIEAAGINARNRAQDIQDALITSAIFSLVGGFSSGFLSGSGIRAGAEGIQTLIGNRQQPLGVQGAFARNNVDATGSFARRFENIA